MTYRSGDAYGTRSRPRYRIAHLGEYFPCLMPSADASYWQIIEWNKSQTWQKLGKEEEEEA